MRAHTHEEIPTLNPIDFVDDEVWSGRDEFGGLVDNFADAYCGRYSQHGVWPVGTLLTKLLVRQAKNGLSRCAYRAQRTDTTS